MEANYATLLAEYNKLYDQTKPIQDAALHWFNEHAKVQLQLQARDRIIEKLNGNIEGLNQASALMTARVAQLTSSLDEALRDRKETQLAMQQKSEALAKEERARQAAERRVTELEQLLIATQLRPLEDRLASVSRTCQSEQLFDGRNADAITSMKLELDGLLRELLSVRSNISDSEKPQLDRKVAPMQRTISILLARISKAPKKPPTCATCRSPVDDLQERTLLSDCGHEHHEECMRGYLNSKLRDLTAYPIMCPGGASAGSEPMPCKSLLTYDIVESLFIGQKEVNKIVQQFQRWQIMTQGANRECVECPNCSGPLLGNRDGVSRVTCGYCRQAFCAACNVAWHAEKTCDEFKAWQDEKSPAHQMFLKYASEQGLVQCNCKRWFEKNKGCNHMKCPFCSSEWCDKCKTKFAAGEWSKHYSTRGSVCFEKMYNEQDVIYP